MSNVMTLTKMKNKKNEEAIDSDSEIIPIKKKELIARLEGEELRYQACYNECVKHAITAKTAKEETIICKKILETNEPKFRELKNENDILKNELSIYKTKSSKASKEIESKKTQVKSTEDFDRDVEEGSLKEKERLEKMRKSLEERYMFK